MEEVLYQSNLMRIGSFTMPVNNPKFYHKGHVEKPLIVFPRNNIWIQHHDENPFIADASLINLYNRHQLYQRYALDARGDFCHLIELSESLLLQFNNDNRTRSLSE